MKVSKFKTCGNSVLFMAKCSQFLWRKLESVVCHLKKTCSLQSGSYATFLKVLQSQLKVSHAKISESATKSLLHIVIHHHDKETWQN